MKIWDVEETMNEQPKGADLIVKGDLNVDLERTDGQGQHEDIVVVVATAGLEDLLVHFLPRRRSWRKYQSPWEMVYQGGW